MLIYAGGFAMPCELLACCQFFKDKMNDLPKSADYIRKKLCLDDYKSCKRYQAYVSMGKEQASLISFSDEVEDAKKAMNCLHNSRSKSD